MTDKVDNLILAQLREMRSDMSELRSDVADIRERVIAVEMKVDGMTLLLTSLAGFVSSHETRVGRLEGVRNGGDG